MSRLTITEVGPLPDEDDDVNENEPLHKSFLLHEIEGDRVHIATRKKKFLFRLVVALHSSGNLSFRTEEYIKRCAEQFGLKCVCTIFPVSAMFAIHDNTSTDLLYSTSYTVPIGFGFHCQKLNSLDQLCHDIIVNGCNFEVADKRLLDIENAPQL